MSKEGKSFLPDSVRKVIVTTDVFFLNTVSWIWGAKYAVDEDDRWIWMMNGSRPIQAFTTQKNYSITRVK